MPPDIDVYVHGEGRDVAAIETFLDHYVERWRDEGRWLGNEPIEQDILRGLSDRTAAFARYAVTDHPLLSGAILAFTSDGTIVFGLRVDYEANDVLTCRVAEVVLDDLMATTGASEGFAMVEEPPPLSIDGWRAVTAARKPTARRRS